MKKLIAVLCIAYPLLSIAQKKPGADNKLAGIDAKLQPLLSVWKVAGFAVAVVDKNKILYAKGFGYGDYEKKIPVTPNTLFAIGSCSKAFTSSLLGLLRNENKIDFDKSPTLYLPELSFFNNEMNTQITVRDMMCHRTGLPRHDFSWYLFNTDSRDSLLLRLKYQEPTAGVRQRWQYNNFMFMVQGMIVEKISGVSWEQNIKDRLFQPLNMTRSDVSIAELEKSPDAAIGYKVKDDKDIVKTDYYPIRGMAPAGSINSSVNDMANWVMAWINGGKFNGKEILPHSYVTEAISSQMVVAGGLPSKEHPDLQFANYGFGWGMTSYKGHYRVEHGGNIDGFSASTCFFPSDSIGIIVLVNQNGSSVPSIVRNIIADRLLGLTPTDWSKELKDAADKGKKEAKEAKAKVSVNRKTGTKPSHLLEEFEGRYSNPGYGTIIVRVKKDSLFAITPHVSYWLKHYHYDVFQPFEAGKKEQIDTTESSEVRFNFHTGNSGEIESANISGMEALSKPLEFLRLPAEKKITPEELKKYVGEYTLGSVVAKVFIKGENTMFLFVPGQPEYELLYLGQNKFAIKNLTGYKLEFAEGPNGTIDQVSFVQPNGTFKAERKK